MDERSVVADEAEAPAEVSGASAEVSGAMAYETRATGLRDSANQIDEMDAIECCLQYIEAWSAHDADLIQSTFAPGGTYSDPLTNGPIAGSALRAYAQGLWTAFPDLAFEAGLPVAAPGAPVVVPWTMTGTNTGSMNGLPPTGRRVVVKGIDLFQVTAKGIVSVTGYFDSAAVPRQLGLQVIVQPVEIGPVKFGTSKRIGTGKQLRAGAVGITELTARSDAEVAQVQELSRTIAMALLDKAGFIGLTTTTVGRHMMTFSSWDSAQSLRESMRDGSHVEAVRRFFGPDLAEGGSTSVWSLDSVSVFRRCPACGRMKRLEGRVGYCRCGELLQAIA